MTAVARLATPTISDLDRTTVNGTHTTSAKLNKRALIREHASGLSFVDIGGLWGTRGETVTTAAEGGASRLAMADIQTPGGPWWKAFAEHCADRGVEGYDEVQVDICAPDAPERLGHWDFVHCAGVMYHVADLFRFVGNLVAVADKYLLLSSVVMPDRIEGPTGHLDFGADHAYLAPVLDPEHRQLVGDYWKEQGMTADGINKPIDYIVDGRPRFTPWWWLFSGEFMARVVSLHGLEIVAQGRTPAGHGHTIFARVPSA